MSNNKSFPAKLVKSARKSHNCFACTCNIPAGYMYIAYPVQSDGKFVTTHLCIECGYLMTQKTGPTARTIREGEFQDKLIPNFLRKKRTEFRRNPTEAAKASGLIGGANG